MSLSVALGLVAGAFAAIAFAVRFFVKRAAEANAERVAQQILDSARRQQAAIDADEPPKSRTEAETRNALKLKHGGK